MKRIRYERNSTGELVSDEMLGGIELFTAKINLERMSYAIYRKGQLKSIIEGKAPSSQMLKIKVKKMLVKLGVNFELEMRPRIELKGSDGK